MMACNIGSHSKRSLLAAITICSAIAMAPYAVQAQIDTGADSSKDPIAIYKQTGIDKDQEKKILALAGEYEHVANEKAQALLDSIKRMRKLSMSPTLDERAIMSTQDAINKLQNGMAMDKVRLLISIRKVLNPEQRQRLIVLLQKQRHEPDQQNITP